MASYESAVQQGRITRSLSPLALLIAGAAQQGADAGLTEDGWRDVVRVVHFLAEHVMAEGRKDLIRWGLWPWRPDGAARDGAPAGADDVHMRQELVTLHVVCEDAMAKARDELLACGLWPWPAEGAER